MDHDRLKNALADWRRNQRAARRAQGLKADFEAGRLDAPVEASMDGVDATLEELVAYLLWERGQRSSILGTLQRAAVLGMAVEVGGHELNTEMSRVNYVMRRVQSRLKDEGTWSDEIESAKASLRRLEDGIGYRSRLGKPNNSHSVTGTKILEAIDQLVGRGLAADKVRLEVTESFMEAQMKGRTDDVVPVYVNLVRNAWRWTRDAGRERVIRLDAYTVEFPPEDASVDPEDEEDGYKGRPTYETVGVVEDSGVGIPKGHEEDIFRPFKTSGFGGTGIGLYICRRNMEQARCTTVVDPAGSDLGGARFLIGPTRVLDKVPAATLDDVESLALEALAIAGLHLDGRSDLIPRMHGDTYAEIMRETLRIRLEGARDKADRALLHAAEAMQGILEGRLDATALLAFENEALPFPAGMGR